MLNIIRCCLLFFPAFLFLRLDSVYPQMRIPDEMQFTHLTTKAGLSQSTVNSIIKDKAGFMWFGTSDGLNRYDGYKFKVYRNIKADPGSIPGNVIKVLFIDRAGKLWAGTLGGGLASYNEKSDSFDRYGSGVVYTIYEDRKGNLWIGTFEGLFIVDRKKKKVIPAEKYDLKLKALGKQLITAVIQDDKNNFWIGTNKGLYLSSEKSKGLKIFYTGRQTGGLTNDEITVLLQDRKGRLWAGTRGGLNRFDYNTSTFAPAYSQGPGNKDRIGGVINSLFLNTDHTIWIGREDCLGFFNPDKSSFTAIRTDAHDSQSLNHNSVYSIYRDNQQILWVGTYSGGINKYDKNQSFVSHYKIYDPKNQKTNTNLVTSFAEGFKDELWIGTDEGGLFSWNSFSNTYSQFNIFENSTYKPGHSILTLLRSKNKESLWIGTYKDGLFRLNLRTQKLQGYNIANGTLKSNSVFAILEDRNGKIWAGTNGGGVSVINPATGYAEHFSNDPTSNSLINNTIRSFVEDKEGNIWIGTYGGISIFNPHSKKFDYFTIGNSHLSGNIIYALFRDSDDNIWVGTMGAGLSFFNKSLRDFANFSERQGLSNDIINSILEDKEGYLWISTSRGVNKFDRKKLKFTNFLSQDGLKTNEFNRGAGYISSNGEILFGSVEGFNIFNPDNIRRNTFIPPVVITDFQLPDNSIPGGVNKVRKLNASSHNPISLSYDQSVFTIEFAALSYSAPEKNTYACMLEGFDKGWHYTGYDKKVTYTNLDPGEYLFKVKAANNDGVWNNEGTTLKIIIKPPFWKTNWAYGLYVIIIGIILYFIFYELKTREKLKNELVLEKLTSEKMKELNQLKLNFFTNVSHELRTPLSLIIDPLRKITEEEVSIGQIKNLSNLAFKNSSRLLSLVNQLLDFRKFEGSLKLDPVTVNIIETIQDVAHAFRERASKRDIEFSIEFSAIFQTATIDVDKFQKILTNLISNAFKFTPDGGKIKLLSTTYRDEKGSRQLEIKVEDTGPGVPEAYKLKIFDIFFQVQHTPRFGMESSGIGLALVRELVQLHNGEIFEKGKEGEGALFVLKIPAGEETDPDVEPFSVNPENDYNHFQAHEVIPGSGDAQIKSDVTVLLVEDNVELRKYIAWYLSVHYRVEEATNGQEGYQKALSLIPDLIVSDVMMKDGDGLELCNKIKTDERTCHIPVILLTAKQADESKIEGYKSGADAYISKPFNSELLETRIANLLSSRKKLLSLFSENPDLNTQFRSKLSELDTEFLKKAEEIVQANLLQTNFDIEQFAELLKMNRRQLSRKLKAVINQAPQEFLIQVRLKKAIELMLQENLTISEAAYRVGFSEPANFSRSFSKVYGKSPKKYLEEIYGRNNDKY